MNSQSVKEKGEMSVCTSSNREELVHVSHLQMKERKDVCTRKYIIIMHSHTVMDKGETSVCTSSKQRRVGEIFIISIM